MVLSDQHKKLLTDIFSASLKSPKGINSARFRADNEQFIPELDKLEILGYLQRRNDLYSINPLALAYLAKENTDAQSIVQKCGFVFALLKSDYRDNLGKVISVSDIARKTGLSVDDVWVALSFIIQIPILKSYSIKEELIAPSESILKYKSFEDILFKLDIEQGIRDEQGKLIEEPVKNTEQKYSVEVLVQLFDSMQFHPKIVQASRKLFEDGHYRDAILRAFIEVNSFVKAKTGLELDGKALMSRVFRIENPIIKLNELKAQSEKDEQEGFMFLFMGAMVGIRNPKAHDNIIQKDPLRTLEYLALASMLMRRAE